jgi:arginine utilization regulatory protein
LRDRREDIPLLVNHFIEKYNSRFHMNVKGLSSDVIHSFHDYEWHGNVRELEHMIEAAMNIMMEDEEIIMYYHLPYQYRSRMHMKEKLDPISAVDTYMNEHADLSAPLKDQMELFEKAYIQQVLGKNGNNISRAAAILGLSRQSLQYRMKKLDLKLNEH